MRYLALGPGEYRFCWDCRRVYVRKGWPSGSRYVRFALTTGNTKRHVCWVTMGQAA